MDHFRPHHKCTANLLRKSHVMVQQLHQDCLKSGRQFRACQKSGAQSFLSHTGSVLVRTGVGVPHCLWLAVAVHGPCARTGAQVTQPSKLSGLRACFSGTCSTADVLFAPGTGPRLPTVRHKMFNKHRHPGVRLKVALSQKLLLSAELLVHYSLTLYCSQSHQ